MLLSAVSVLVVAQSTSEIPEGLMNNPVYLSRAFALITSDFYLTPYLVLFLQQIPITFPESFSKVTKSVNTVCTLET